MAWSRWRRAWSRLAHRQRDHASRTSREHVGNGKAISNYLGCARADASTGSMTFDFGGFILTGTGWSLFVISSSGWPETP